MICAFVCVCWTTMRVLSDMSQMILQRCTTVAHHLPTSLDTPYKQAIFRSDLTFKREPWMLLYQNLLTGWCICWISNYDYRYYPQAHMRAHARWLAWSNVHHPSKHLNARSIVRWPDYTYDAVASSYNTRFCCTTNAPGRKTYRKIYYISLHNGRLLAPQNVRAFERAFFFMRTFIKQLANFFTRTTFWSHPIVQQLWQAP